MIPAVASLLIQSAALCLAFLLALAGASILSAQVLLSWSALVFVQAGLACGLSILFRQAYWWWGLHLIFMPALVWVRSAHIDPLWGLAAFVVCALSFWNSARSQVPLYLSNRKTADALMQLLPAQPRLSFIDAGCGTGGLLRHLARACPGHRFVGLENAPLPFLLAWLRCRGSGCTIRWANFWRRRFDDADVVYAFLSPAPMPRLWQKLRDEMKPGALLVSNSFPVPDVAPTRVIAVGDRRGTQLYCYRIPDATTRAGTPV